MSLTLVCDACGKPIVDGAAAVEVTARRPGAEQLIWHVHAEHVGDLALEAPEPPAPPPPPTAQATQRPVDAPEDQETEWEELPVVQTPLDLHFDQHGKPVDPDADEHAILSRMGPAAIRELAERRARAGSDVGIVE